MRIACCSVKSPRRRLRRSNRWTTCNRLGVEHEADHADRPLRAPGRSQSGAVPRRNHRHHAEPRQWTRRRARAVGAVSRHGARHGVPRESKDRNGVFRAVRGDVRTGHSLSGSDGRSGRREDFRATDRAGGPHPYGRGGQRRPDGRQRRRSSTRGHQRRRHWRCRSMTQATLSAGDTSWVLVSSALVLLMTVGLAFFYGGLVRPKNALNTMMMSVVALGVIGVQWMLVGYSIAFSPGNGWLGGLSWLGLNNVGLEPNATYSATIPLQAHAMFQGMFAIITPALISGAIVERMRFRGYIVFLVLWATLIYDPLAHWVWGSGGWLLKRGALDFAGGTVVHISAGVSALVAAWFLGPRRDYRRVPIAPHNVPLVLLGAGLLWFGWFGFNAGSALAANGLAALAFVNTNTAAAAALVTWAALDLIRTGKITAVGAATGLVVGLVGITPAAGYVKPLSGLLIGVLAAVVSYTAIQIRSRTKLDDALDVFSCHGLAGMAGALLTGVFATKLVNPAGGDGLLAGNAAQLGVQLLAVVAAAAFAAAGTAVILKFLQVTIGARAGVSEESAGLDLSQHGEEAYFGSDLGSAAGTGSSLGGSVVVETFAIEPAPGRLRASDARGAH